MRDARRSTTDETKDFQTAIPQVADAAERDVKGNHGGAAEDKYGDSSPSAQNDKVVTGAASD